MERLFLNGSSYTRDDISKLLSHIKTLDDESQAIFSSYIEQAVSRRHIDSQMYLGQALVNLREGKDLYHIGLALRLGANANKAIEISEYSPAMHPVVIVSIEFIKGDLPYEVFVDAFNILLQFGANTLYPSFDYHGDLDMHYISEMECDEEATPNINVEEWMMQNELKPVYFDMNVQPEPQKSYLAAILDAPYLFDTSEMEESEYLQVDLPDMLFLMKCLSYKILQRSPIDAHHFISLENKGIRDTVRCMNPQAYRILASRGFETTYFSVNRACYLYQNSAGMVSKMLYRDIISEMIRTGHTLTLDQLYLIKEEEEYFRGLYEIEKWRKLASKPEHNFNELRKIAFELNLDYNSDVSHLIQSFERIDQNSADDILKMLKERQCKRLRDSLALGQPDCECPDTAYADARVVFYMENGRVYSFNSDLYSSLLQSGLNPYTRQALPINVIEQIRSNLSILKTTGYRLDADTATEVSKFKEVDRITDDEDKYILSTVESASRLRGIPSLQLPLGLMMLVMSYISLDVDYMPNIEPEHQLHVFARSIYEYTKTNVSESSFVYDYILSLLSV
jgi:hypothetical protein